MPTGAGEDSVKLRSCRPWKRSEVRAAPRSIRFTNTRREVWRLLTLGWVLTGAWPSLRGRPLGRLALDRRASGSPPRADGRGRATH
jgi:hypothetical protein